MNCTICESVMENRDEIHHLSNNKFRMNLHCTGHLRCPARKEITYSAHVGVIKNDPAPWECYEYNLPFYYENDWYILNGNSKNNTTILHRNIRIIQDWNILIGGNTYYFGNLNHKKQICKVDFTPIATGDNMISDAWKTFHKLYNLSIFS